MRGKFTRRERRMRFSRRKIRSCANSSKGFRTRRSYNIYEQITTGMEGRFVCVYRPGVARGADVAVQQGDDLLSADVQDPAACGQCRGVEIKGDGADVGGASWNGIEYQTFAGRQERDDLANDLR